MKITNPMFLQSASNIKREPEVAVLLQYSVANPILYQVSSIGEVKVKSIYQGAPKVETYDSLSDTQLSIQSDANTKIKLIGVFTKIDSCNYGSGTGHITRIELIEQNELLFLGCAESPDLEDLNLTTATALQALYCSGCSGLTSLDLQENINLKALACSRCGLTSLDLEKNIALEDYLYCSLCPELTSLNIIKCTELTTLDLTNSSKIRTIRCVANKNNVATAIAGAITNATAEDGTVYVSSTDPFFSIIQTAATAKGWTVEEPQA